MRFDDGLGDGEAHAGSLDLKTLIFAAVKFFKNEALLGIVNAIAAVSNTGDQKIAIGFGGDGDGLVVRRILIRILDQMDENFRSAGQVRTNAREAVGGLDADGAVTELGLGQ